LQRSPVHVEVLDNCAAGWWYLHVWTQGYLVKWHLSFQMHCKKVKMFIFVFTWVDVKFLQIPVRKTLKNVVQFYVKHSHCFVQCGFDAYGTKLHFRVLTFIFTYSAVFDVQVNSFCMHQPDQHFPAKIGIIYL